MDVRVIQHRRWLSGSIITAFLILLLSLAANLDRSAVRAQGTTIAYGQQVQGQITAQNFRVIYTFAGREGDILEASMTRTDGTLDPQLLVIDPTNSLIAINDDGARFNAVLTNIKLPSSGTYFLIATRFGQEQGLTTGKYSLKLSRVGVVAATLVPDATNSPETRSIQFGDSVVDEIDNATFQRIFVFGALRGDLISIRMQRISGDLDAQVFLADAQGTILKSSDDDPNSVGTLDAAIYDFRIRTTGSYLLVATRFGAEGGASRGGFSLSLNRQPLEVMGLTAETAILLENEVEYRGSITKDQLLNYYLVEARAGDVLTIEARRTKGNLDPTLQILSSDLQRLLATNDGGQRGVNARISAYSVVLDGTYVVVVSRFSGADGQTAGDYVLTLRSGRGEPAATPTRRP